MALSRQEKATAVKEFAVHSTDTGSVEVQVALLTQDILKLTEHCKANHKDYSTKRGLLKKVSQRKLFLKYLKRTNEQKYKEITDRLGLKQQ